MDLGEFLWDLVEHGSLNDHQRQLDSHDLAIDKANVKIRELNSRITALTWTCETLCNLLIEKLGVSEMDLKALIQQQRENSIRSSGTCPECGHRFHESRTACLYCGFAPEPASPQ